MTKVIVGLLLVVAAAGAYYLVGINRERASELGGEQATTTPALSEFYSERLGVAFSYSNVYDATTTRLSNGGNSWQVVTLVPKGYVAPEDGDGPAAISLQVIPNTKKLSAEQWIMKDSRSNWQLNDAPGGLGSTTIGGESALVYTYSGLYNTSAVVVARDPYIYFFTGEWNAPEDQIRSDFQTMLGSLQFVDIHE